MPQAFAALPPGGAFIALDLVIDDARRSNVWGLLMSLDMLMEFDAERAFDYTFKVSHICARRSWFCTAGVLDKCVSLVEVCLWQKMGCAGRGQHVATTHVQKQPLFLS